MMAVSLAKFSKVLTENLKYFKCLHLMQHDFAWEDRELAMQMDYCKRDYLQGQRLCYT